MNKRTLAILVLGAKQDGREAEVIYDSKSMRAREFHSIVWFRNPSTTDGQRARTQIRRCRHNAEYFAEPQHILGRTTNNMTTSDCFESARNWLPSFDRDQLRTIITEATAHLLNPA